MTSLPAATPLDHDALIRLASATTPDREARCEDCRALDCAGWEGLPGSFDRDVLEQAGTLRDAAVDDPTVAEYHPAGTHIWSPDAPIAPAWFPYNRCDAWRCRSCARAFLRYTEHGGYYTEDRIRELDARLVVDVPAPAR